MNSLFKTIQIGSLLMFFTMSNAMDYVTIITQDLQHIKVEATSIQCSNTLVHATQDSDNTLTDLTFVVPITTENFMMIFPLFSIIEEVTEPCERATQLKNRLFQERNISEVRCIELLNAVNFLDCPVLIDFFLTILAEETIKKCDYNSRDAVLNWVTQFDLPHELSVALGQKIIAKSFDSDCMYSLNGLLEEKNVAAFAFSSDKTLCAYAQKGNGVTVVDVRTKKPIMHYAKFVGNISDICFSRDGSLIAFASQVAQNTALRVYSLETQKCINRFNAQNRDAKALSFSGNSKVLLMSSCNDELIKYNRRHVDKEPRIFECENKSGPYRFNEEGNIVADEFYSARKKIDLLLLTRKDLCAELLKLRAEYALLFVMIINNSVRSDTFDLSDSPYTRIYYNELKKNPVIKSSLSQNDSALKSSCLIS